MVLWLELGTPSCLPPSSHRVLHTTVHYSSLPSLAHWPWPKGMVSSAQPPSKKASNKARKPLSAAPPPPGWRWGPGPPEGAPGSLVGRLLSPTWRKAYTVWPCSQCSKHLYSAHCTVPFPQRPL
uniref:Uncharacterized protein n=1 Tax=Mus musculus TaxID=10090 RepID=Q8C7E3_MOUSE|nr:unnamed protein product [Mus musculus]